MDAAQKRQSGWRELLITSTAIGRTILTAVTPAIVEAIKAVQQWADANQAWIRTAIVEKVGQFADYLKGLDWAAIGKGIQDFTREVRDIVTAADDAAKGFSDSSPLMKGLEAMTLLIGGRVLGSVVALAVGLRGLSGISLSGPLGALLLNPAVLGTAAVGAVLASGDPNKSVLAGGRPDVTPQDNNLGLPGVDSSSSDTSRPRAIWDWMKANAAPDFGKAGEQLKAVGKAIGWGDRLHDDAKTKDNIEDTAKSTKGILDVLKAGASSALSAFTGVTESSGGLGGSGRHADGSGPGASLRDRQFHGKGNFGQKGWWTPERQSHAVDYLMKNAGLTEDGAKALVARWRFVESAGGPTSVNPRGGATGIGQWLGDRQTGGYNGTFDQQLQHATDELNGKEGRAKKLLNTPGMEANGASAYERAEGWNARTNTDNFTGTVREGMKHIVHGVVSAASTAQAPVPAAPSAAAVTDAEVQAARQRIQNGSRDPKDRALVGRYLKEQNTPSAAPTAAHALAGAVRAATPVPVDVTERSAHHITKPINEALHKRMYGARRAHYNHDIERVSELGRSMRAAAHSRLAMHSMTSAVDRSTTNTTTIHGMTVHTRATDGRELMADLDRHLARNREVPQSNSGLA